MVANRGVEAVQTTSLGYGVVDIIVADIIVVPLVVGQRGKDSLCGGTGVDVHNGISTFPIVDIPNSGVGSVCPTYFSRVRMGVVAICVVNWVKCATGLSYLGRGAATEAASMIVENAEIVLAMLQIQVGYLAMLLGDGDLLVEVVWVSAIVYGP